MASKPHSQLLMLGCVLALAILKVPSCYAQAEIAPDHFEFTNTEPAVPIQNNATGLQHKTGPRAGLALTPDAGHARLTLPSGTYSLSVVSQGKESVLVTLIPDGDRQRVQTLHVRITPRSSSESPSGLVFEREDRRRTPGNK